MFNPILTFLVIVWMFVFAFGFHTRSKHYNEFMMKRNNGVMRKKYERRTS